jgi:hypothetical protein
MASSVGGVWRPSGQYLSFVVVRRLSGSDQRRVNLPLVERTKHKDKFPVEQWAFDTVNNSRGNGAEAGVALDLIIPHDDGDVV